MVFSWVMFFCQDVVDHCTLAGSADSPLFIAVTIPHHRCSVANKAWDPLASVGLMQTIWAVLARGANCTNVHLARCREGLDLTSLSRADGLLAPSHQRLGDGARHWARIFLGAQQSWCSLNP